MSYPSEVDPGPFAAEPTGDYDARLEWRAVAVPMREREEERTVAAAIVQQSARRKRPAPPVPVVSVPPRRAAIVLDPAGVESAAAYIETLYGTLAVREG